MKRKRKEEAEMKESWVEEKQESWLESKIKAIHNSAMPEKQKMELLKKIGALKEDVVMEGKIPFNVYAKIRKIEVGRHQALLAYPKAKNVDLASLKEWDEIFKNF